jgi:hypothetical protein
MSGKATACSDADVCDKNWKFERDFALRFYEAMGTPLGLRQTLCLQNEDYNSVNSLPIDPGNYQEPRQFAEDYQVAELLRKSLNTPGVSPAQRSAKALSKFIACEAHNAETNTRLMAEIQPEWFGTYSYHLLHILGNLDAEVLNSLPELGKFGPGVNVGVRGEGLVPSIKYDTKPVATLPLIPYLEPLMGAHVADFWGSNLQEKARAVEGNGHFTVPKNWEIDRCAAKEPLWNSFLQSGIGTHIGRRLKRFGVDLHDQRWNQALASKAMDWGLATIDLSSASDLLSRVLVWLSLCYNQDSQGMRWYHLLCLARSPRMKMPGNKEHVALEMFASMGNGFTFPLETAIFLAVVRSVVPREDWSVCTAYGDDMIVPQRFAGQVVERLEYLGFKVNGEKTCLAGAFFESCGTDWFQGQNVRPFYLHQDPDSQIPYALQAANALRAWCVRVYGKLPRKFRGLWLWCKGRTPYQWRVYGPPELGDSCLHLGLTEAVRAGVARPLMDIGPGRDFHQWEGYLATHVRLATVDLDRRSFGVLACGLLQLEGGIESASLGREPVRGLFGRLRTEKSVVLWEDDFSWE